ncbi:MAG: hypothetical protein PHW28_04870, partial [Mesotoga sp.]|nr:hypothetical protein [Mesotoga sp.]
MGKDNPPFFILPYLAQLILIKKIFYNSSFILNNINNGVILAGGFISVYLVLLELLPKRKKKDINAQLAGLVAGLFLVLSPILIYDWDRALYAINQILVYPLIFFFFLRFINKKKYLYLVLAVITSTAFSLNFSFSVIPWSLAFFLFTFLFFFLYSLVKKNFLKFTKGFGIFIFIFLLAHLFHLLPQIINFQNSSYSQLAFNTNQAKSHGLTYFLSIRPYISLVYNISNQPQYKLAFSFNPSHLEILDGYTKYIFLSFIFPLLICLGLLAKKSKQMQSLMSICLLVFLITLFLMTANITNTGGQIYKALFSIPGFAMFRSFINKFSMTYVFFYSILLGLSLYTILERIEQKKTKYLLPLFLSSLIIFNGWPLISGKIVNIDLWQSRNVRSSIKMDPHYELFIKTLDQIKTSGKIVSFPLTNEAYQVLKGEGDGAYFGPPTIPILTGKNTFSGMGSFDNLRPVAETLLREEKIVELKRFFSLLNIHYIFHNDDDYIYSNFPDYPYSTFLKGLFPDQKTIKNFVKDFDFKEELSITSYHLYKNENYFLPLFYIPQNTIYSPNDIEILPDIVGFDDYEIRSAIFLADEDADNADIKNADKADREDTDNTDIGADNAGKDADKADEENADNTDKRARITRIEGADEIFVKGENKKDIEKILNQVQDDGEGEIFYPYVKHEPGSLKWKAALLKEKYNEWKARKEVEKLIEKKLFYGNKRVNEIMKFQISNSKFQIPIFKNYDLTEMWLGDINGATGLLDKIEDEKKRTEWAIKIKKTIADNALNADNADRKNTDNADEKSADKADEENADNTDIGADNADGKTLAEQVDRLNQSLDRYIPKLDISKREYEIEIPRAGNYTLFLRNNADNADIIADNTDGNTDKADRKTQITQTGWVEWGEINLEEGKHILLLRSNADNALNADNADRKNTDNTDIGADKADRKTDNADGGVAIAEWRNNQWYQVKGKLIEETKIGQEKIIIEQKDKEEEEKKEEAEWKEIKMYQPNENEFTFYFKSGDS